MTVTTQVIAWFHAIVLPLRSIRVKTESIADEAHGFAREYMTLRLKMSRCYFFAQKTTCVKGRFWRGCNSPEVCHLIARWGNELAGDIKPLEIQRWMKSLHTINGLAWTTVAKIRGIMLRIYKVGIVHELVDKNPLEHVETRSQTHYKAVVITPQQTLIILNRLASSLHYTLVLTCVATGRKA